jgi:hypothetical protein
MIKPDIEDIKAIEQQYGTLSSNASNTEAAERYRLAQANKLIRTYGRNQPPKEA